MVLSLRIERFLYTLLSPISEPQAKVDNCGGVQIERR